VVGPVRNVRINDQDAFVARSAVGLRPTLTWDPPSIGNAAAFHIYLCSAVNGLEIGTITTRETELTLPEDVDQPFFALIEAATYEDRLHPPLAYATAKVVTQVMTP
jgi:hypothetical protein